MEILLVLTLLALVSVIASMVLRHQRSVAWGRELDQAFGLTRDREIPRHGRL